jgi:hypothetical protein
VTRRAGDINPPVTVRARGQNRIRHAPERYRSVTGRSTSTARPGTFLVIRSGWGLTIAGGLKCPKLTVLATFHHPRRGLSPKPGRNQRRGHSPGGRRRQYFGPKKRVDLLASDQRFKAVFGHPNRWLTTRAVLVSPRRGGRPAIGVIIAFAAVAKSVKIEPLQENPWRGLGW